MLVGAAWSEPSPTAYLLRDLERVNPLCPGSFVCEMKRIIAPISQVTGKFMGVNMCKGPRKICSIQEALSKFLLLICRIYS